MAITIPLSPPSSQLPPIGKIRNASLLDIINAVGYLRLLYNPEVRGMQRIDRKVVFTASRIATESTEAFTEVHEPIGRHTSASSPDLSLDAFPVDEFERTYVIRWLTSLVACADMPPVRDNSTSDAENSLYQEACGLSWERTIQDAAALLAACAGSASAGLVTRTFAFRHKTGREVKVQITDVPLENQDYSSVGAQTWGSACLLAEVIVHNPVTFGLDHLDRPEGPMRILELGAGTGLVSLTIGGLLKGYSDDGGKARHSASVVATDFHPCVLQNLHDNIAYNTTAWPASCPVSVAAHYLDWSDLPPPDASSFCQPFDLIFGADIVYEVEHAQWIRACVERFLRRPSIGPDVVEDEPRFHLVIPLRRTHAAESRAVEEAFPFASEAQRSASALGVIAKEILVCDTQGGLRSRSAYGSLVEYAHYTIAWV